MKITKIETQKRNAEKANIFVDEKYHFSISLNGLIESGLCENQEITEGQIEAICQQDAPKLAFLQALSVVSYGMKTEAELRRKLNEKGFSEDAVQFAVDKMQEYDYINDSNYVKSYILSRAIPQHWGNQKIIGNLLKKGVSMTLIKEGLAENYDDEIQKENACMVAEKYCRSLKDMETRKRKDKIYRHLASKGFSYDVISYAVMKNMEEDNSAW